MTNFLLLQIVVLRIHIIINTATYGPQISSPFSLVNRIARYADMQISYVFIKRDTWEICIRCFLDSDDEVTSICDARFIVIQVKCGIGALSTKCKCISPISLKDIPRVVAFIGNVY